MIQFDLIRAHDPELCGYMEEELARQRSHLELIASENFVSETVMAARAAISPTNTQKATPENALLRRL